MKNLLLFILTIIVASISALFFAQNDSIVQIKYFGGSFEWPMHWVLVSMFTIGVIIGVLSLLMNLMTTKVKLANLRRKLTKKEKEISSLRASSFKEE